MQSHPAEPIVAVDDLDPKDTFTLEAPVERAIDVLAQAYADDPLCAYFAKEGQERDYMCRHVEALRQGGCFHV